MVLEIRPRAGPRLLNWILVDFERVGDLQRVRYPTPLVCASSPDLNFKSVLFGTMSVGIRMRVSDLMAERLNEYKRAVTASKNHLRDENRWIR